ncbi:GlcNAc-PI de-N-acetylase [Longimycelium tulufanense]|uniref:GlcNAc-PI de-N-acetylase n=1 Tax=Longimycelium tulufanense TaxID=907463 RepID=A0A8J3CKA3_9PSEU|nr:GlcNAc-PI de-N-acetylase [Longimycelium tulufanense]
MDLAEFPEDWSSALVVVAHPDDVEYGCASAVARWTGQGRRVAYLLATRGEAGIDGMPPAECAEVRAREQVASAAEVGVTVVEFLDHPDGMVEYGLPLRRDVARAVRRHRPEAVIVVNHRENYAPGVLNQADHRVVGQAAIDAVADAGNRWVFRELVDEGLAPWSGVRHIAVDASPRATHAVDITDTLAAGVRSLRQHRAYLEGLGPSWPEPEVFLRAAAENVAGRFGGRLGVAFELLRTS